ncbi:MAG: hypothetical protein BGP06_17210 [Rhizobiales bacterium 65-9]|nr:MAG: hypothetical protein BGP06_17210 [Rhizobiales bacterium 65-9]
MEEMDMLAAGTSADPLAPLRNLGEEGVNCEAYLRRARAVLQDFVARPERIPFADLKRDPKAYTRNLLFGDDRLSIWAIVWPPGSSTSIHDHHCSCCFGVARGALEERWFDAIGDGRAALTNIAVREPGYVACMLPSGPNIHQMRNRGDEEVVTVHIYGFDHTQKASSIETEYSEALR